jgi:hypothetical protein
MKRLLLVCCSLLLLVISCVSDYDGLLSESEPIPVLNGALYSDSLLSINLSMSNHSKEKEFEPITNATFNLIKNGIQISSSYKQSDDGTYYFNDTCRNGDNYEVEVQFPGFATLSSKTVIPHKPSITLTEIKKKENQRPSQNFDLEINYIGKEINALYVFLFLGERNENGFINWEQRGIYCNSPFTDPFNRFFDSWAPEGFSHEYEYFVRFPIDNLPNENLQTELAFLGGSEIARFYVLAATKEYDLYYKGGYLQRSFDPNVNLPFTYQPIFLPSNINGGVGIFSGIDLSVFDFRNEQ